MKSAEEVENGQRGTIDPILVVMWTTIWTPGFFMIVRTLFNTPAVSKRKKSQRGSRSYKDFEGAR